jgi:hypothetical protein
MEAIFGASVIHAVVKKIQEDYVGAEMTVAEVLANRPALFERAFLEIVGPRSGESVLAFVWKATLYALELYYYPPDSPNSETEGLMPAPPPELEYAKKGDLAKCIKAAADKILSSSS